MSSAARGGARNPLHFTQLLGGAENAMHDWTRVDPNEYRSFHGSWVCALYDALNAGLLPAGYYAMVDYSGQTLRPRTRRVSVCTITPRRHTVVAIVEIVSPSNKAKRSELRDFVGKVTGALDTGVHVLVIDPFPPGPHDPEGIHGVVWRALTGRPFELPEDKPLTLAAYEAQSAAKVGAFVEPVAVGDALRDMPLFLSPDAYVNAPLEATYQTAWAAFPATLLAEVAP